MALFQQKQQLSTTAPQLSLIDTRGNSANLLFQCHSSHTQLQGPYLIPNSSQQMAAFQTQQQQPQSQSNIVYHHYYHHLHHHHYLNSNSSGPNSGSIVCCPNNNNTTNTGPNVPAYLHPYRNNNRNTIDSNPIIVLQPPPPPPQIQLPPPSIPLPQQQSIVCTAAVSATAIPPRIFYNNPNDLNQYQYKSNGWIPVAGTGSSASSLSLNSHHRKYPAQSITVQSPILISAIQDTAQNSSVSASSSPSSSSSSSSSSLYPNSSSPSSGTTNSISPSTGSDPDTATSEEMSSSSSSSELSSSSSSPPRKHTEEDEEEEPETNEDSETPTETPTVKSVNTAEVPTVLATKSAATVPSTQIHLSSSSSSSSSSPLSQQLPPQQNVQYPVQFTMPGYHSYPSYASVAPSMQLIQSQPLPAPPPPTVQQLITLSAPPPPPPPASGTALRDYYAQFGVYYRLTSWNQSYGMERVWMSEFRRIFSNFYCELWSIQPVERKPGGIRLNMFVDSAKVRFCCEKCGHSWTSMKGRIVFWFGLLSPNFNIGLVAIKLFGQKCEVCTVEMFQQPMWYPEEVTKVLMNLFNRVGQIYYGFEKTKFEKQRRIGKPRTPHNQYLCQACTEGICLSRRRQLSEQSGQPEPTTARANQKKEESHEEDQPENQPEEKNEKKDLETDPQSEIPAQQQQEPQDHSDQKECPKKGSSKGIQELVIKKKINFSDEDDEDSEDSGIVSLV